MPNLSMLPLQGTLQALQTNTTNGTSAALTLPQCEGYRFFLGVNTVSGTTPTLQVGIYTSPDGGTNYYLAAQFANITTTGLGRQLLIRGWLGTGEVSTEGQSAFLPGAVDQASGAVTLNGPIDPRYIKLRWVAGGTTPSFAWVVQWIGVPQDAST